MARTMRKLALSLSGCGYNEFQRLDEGVTAADFEKGTLEAVVTARASGSLAGP